jgi:alkylation response protein AidB-like acyl-CoA dehydrogenase
MDFNLSEPEKMLQNLARDFAAKEVMPRAAQIDRTGEFPGDMAAGLARLGFRPGADLPGIDVRRGDHGR